MTEGNANAGAMTWEHGNVWAAGKLIATYDTSGASTDGSFSNVGLHFYLNDPLGTRRAQTDYAGVLEQVCQGLPFGDGLACSGTASDPTAHHFTGKERDQESGNDYFDARYYASGFGRFLSPDWSAKVEPVPYAKMADPQSLNLFAYVENNPLIRIDEDGHQNPPSVPEQGGDFVAITFAEGGAKAAEANPAQQQTLSNAQNAAMKNPKFAPGYGGHTHCNQAACSVAGAMHAPMGPLTNAKGTPLGADQIRANLAKPGSGYHVVSAAEASQLGGHGVLVFVTGPDHVATVSADQNQKLPGWGPIISNVGYKNGDMRLDYVFQKSDMPEVRFYTPNQ